MITPLDIQNKEFKRSIRGYDIKEVDIFLDEVIDDYEKIYKENIDLKDRVSTLADQIRQFNAMEETLKNTLVLAQNTSDEVINSAKIKADNIIRDSEINGNRLIDSAREDVRKINREFEYLKREMFSFKIKYESFINAQLMSMERFFDEIQTEELKETEYESSDETNGGIETYEELEESTSVDESDEGVSHDNFHEESKDPKPTSDPYLGHEFIEE